MCEKLESIIYITVWKVEEASASQVVHRKSSFGGMMPGEGCWGRGG